MIITTIPDHPAPMYSSTPVFAISAKMAKDTVYMPSSVAALVLGNVVRDERRAPRSGEGAQR